MFDPEDDEDLDVTSKEYDAFWSKMLEPDDVYNYEDFC